MSDTDWSFFDIPATAVQDNLSAMAGRAEDALRTANSVISSLSGVRFDPEPGMPSAPDLTIDIRPPVAPRIGDYSRFGSPAGLSVPTMEDLWSSLGVSQADFAIDIPVFAPQTPGLVFPTDPAPLDTSGLPTRPTVDTAVSIPVSPDVVMPAMGALAEIVVPDFTFPTLPTFDAIAPQFTASAPSTNIIWSEPTYASTVESDLVLRIRAMLAGGTGLPANIQQALFDQARTREAQTALEAEQGAFDAFAAKGYSMPPGMLARAVMKAQDKSRLEQNAQERDLTAKAAQWEIENLRKAVEQGMAYETMLRGYFNNVATRSYEAAKFRVEADIKLYDAEVSLFNARQQAYATFAQVFKIRTDAALASLEVFKAQIQAAVAKGQLNEQVVKVFVAQVEGVKQIIEVYKAKMEGAKTQSEVTKNIIGAYAEDVKAYAEKVGAEKERFVAYGERVRAEAEKAKALEYEARAYEATVRGAEAKANLKTKYVDARIAALRESVSKFTAQLEGERAVVAASVQAIQANASAFTADTQRYTAEIQGVNENTRTQLLVQQEQTKNNLMLYETRIKEYDAHLGRVIEQAKVIVGALDAAARTSSTLAAGAMSAIHVQAGMSASGSASSTNAYSVNVSRQGGDVA